MASNMIEVSATENEVLMKQLGTGDAVGASTKPLGPWRWVTDGLIEEHVRIWEPRYGRKVGPEEAAQMLIRVVDFIRIMAEHSRDDDGGYPDGEAARTDQMTQITAFGAFVRTPPGDRERAIGFQVPRQLDCIVAMEVS